jgi:Putative beta-barrel porin-2, OmpL-like. bbp2
MKLNKWTQVLAAGGIVSLAGVAHADEASHQVMTALSSTTLSGYVDTSANWRIGKNSGPMPGRLFDGANKQDGFNLNVVNLTLEKGLDDGEWSAGYRVDLLFGPDANRYGTILNGGMAAAMDDFSIKQAYANFRIPAGTGIEVKMGAFDSIIGYESFEAGNNPNYSRSFGYFLGPVQHTGVLASYAVTDLISVSGGVANTAYGFINERGARGGAAAAESEKAYLGSIAITLPDSLGFLSGSTFYGGVVNGLNGNSVDVARAGSNTKDTTSLYGGLTLNTPVEGLGVGGAFDYRFNGSNAVTPGSNWAWVGAVYASYQATEKMKLSARGEWTQGSNGTYYFSPLGAGSNAQNELIGLTLTLDYALWSSLITRVEGRWDRSLNGDRPYVDADPLGGDRNVFTIALNTIYRF